MHLILWRHAEAEDGRPDEQRKLTAHGKTEAKQTAAWLKKHLPENCRIFVSPAVRTQQTALALADNFETREEVGVGATPSSILRCTHWPDGEQSALVVGHQPTLGELAHRLLCGRQGEWSVKKSAVWWFTTRERDSVSEVILKAVIAPDLLK